MSDLKTLPSVCPLDCPDTCSLKLTVDGSRLVKLEGNREHPITRGFACVKMVHYPERQHHPDRLRYPMKRVGPKGSGQFTRITWEEALDESQRRLTQIVEQYGPESVLPYSYAGTMGIIERDFPTAFFRGLGASELDWTICATTGSEAWEMNYGPNKLSTPLEDLPHARTIILWGINALRSNSHLAPWINEARRHGATVLHIDPYHNETSRAADEHWQIAVGTDAALALALGYEIFKHGWEDREYLARTAEGVDEYRRACEAWTPELAAVLCGIEPEKIVALAARMVSHSPTFIKVGYGMTRNEGGGNALRAVTLLPALIGAWKMRGGGAGLSTSGAFGLNTHRVTGRHLQKPNRRHINQNQLGRALAEPVAPIQSLFVFNSNPAAVAPDSSSVRKGLSREDLFTVVLEHFQTDTADYADLLLPATTFLEHPDLYTSYGHYHLQWAEPVLPPLDECRPNSWYFQQLALRMGFTDEVFGWTAEQMATELLRSNNPYLAGITLDRLKQERSIRLNLPEGFRPYAEGSNHPDRKIKFAPAPQQLEFQIRPNEKYPLRLISPPGSHVINTSMGNIAALLKAAGGEPSVIVHPDDASTAGVVDATRIRISSAQGSIERKVRVSTDARIGTVVAVGQWWPKLAPDRKSLNDLTSQDLTDLGGGSLFGNAVVRIEPVA
ncbi:MAG: molybdopterin-dependent oxidoreductase [Pirellulales bacterium]